MTTVEVMSERDRAGWASPLQPMEPGGFWVLYDSRGTYEVMVHPTDAAHLIATGIVLDGEWFRAWKVDEHPLMNGIVLRIQQPAGEAWVEAAVA